MAAFAILLRPPPLEADDDDDSDDDSDDDDDNDICSPEVAARGGRTGLEFEAIAICSRPPPATVAPLFESAVAVYDWDGRRHCFVEGRSNFGGGGGGGGGEETPRDEEVAPGSTLEGAPV
jgi:hypothetical protein